MDYNNFYIYLMLTSERMESHRKFSGVFYDLPSAGHAADLFVGTDEHRTAEIVRLDVDCMVDTNHHSVGMDSMPYGADIVYLVNGAVRKE